MFIVVNRTRAEFEQRVGAVTAPSDGDRGELHTRADDLRAETTRVHI